MLSVWLLSIIISAMALCCKVPSYMNQANESFLLVDLLGVLEKLLSAVWKCEEILFL